jgi:hypothetical protein
MDLSLPEQTYPGQDGIMALHWHPESVPLEQITRRFRCLFPDAREWLLVPTEHNRLVSIDGYCGVEVDCRHRGAKLQLLLHFHGDHPSGDPAFLTDLDHTRAYRARQLDRLLTALTQAEGRPGREQAALEATTVLPGPSDGQPAARMGILAWMERESGQLLSLLDGDECPRDASHRKNKLVRDWLLTRLGGASHPAAPFVLEVLRTIKEQVKADFDPEWFLTAEHWIGRTRALGGTVTLPHPELFPAMLDGGLELDGVEVWNPQSCRRSVELLEDLVSGRIPGRAGLPVLPTFGDDCHLGEKRKPESLRDAEKASREIGVQPAWDWPAVERILDHAGWRRVPLVREWKKRLAARLT